MTAGVLALIFCTVGAFGAVTADSTTSQVPLESSPPVSASTETIRAVHLTGWAAGSPKTRREFISHMKAAGLNTVVIALKEYDGRVFVRGVPLAHEIGAFTNAIPDLPGCVKDFKDAGIRTVGRVVLFKDNTLSRARHALAVHKPDGSLWTNDKGVGWVDPYRKEVWQYNLEVATRAAAYFDEIQFDYIRFPSDGPVKLCRYSRADHTAKTAEENLRELMAFLRAGLPGKPISVAVFGLTTTAKDGMGIGQHIDDFLKEADFVCPMMYPSHYAKGEYGIKDPNRSPYKTIHRGLRDVAQRGGDLSKLRPYLQDFSLGFHYGPAELRAQIFAAARMGVRNWTLWNPKNKYQWAAIPKPDEAPPPEPAETPEKDKESHEKSR